MISISTQYAIEQNLNTEELKALLEITQSLHRSMNIDELLPYIISRSKELMDAETVAVLLYDPSKDEFFFRFTEGNPEESAFKLKEIRFPSHEGIAGSVFKSGAPELIPDVRSDPRHYKLVDDETRFKTKSMAAVPLETRGKVIGVMEACNKRRGVFNERDVKLLMTIAGTVAMALDNARVHLELQRAYEELQLIDREKDSLLERTNEENARLRREVESRYRFDQIKGNSPQILELFRLCEKVINSDVTVLIEGETGTGKELVARCLHYNGPRKGRPFVTQNCGGVPESLLASELFGYKRGAFTGAVSDKKGLFEVAHGGTVFLDEVAEMSPAMQVSLLRVLQEGEVKPLGSSEIKRVSVRVISATNRNLEEYVNKGAFREDLYYRLSVFTVRVPPLREREGDISILTDHFIRKYDRKLNKSIKGLSRQAQICLCAYPFPGNIRELENEIERAVVLAEDGRYIDVSHLSEKILRKSSPTDCEIKAEGKLKSIIESLEKRVLSQKIEEHRGNKTRIAKELGLSRFGLMKKMKRYGL
jgi:Nif-specific regulatory protein